MDAGTLINSLNNENEVQVFEVLNKYASTIFDNEHRLKVIHEICALFNTEKDFIPVSENTRKHLLQTTKYVDKKYLNGNQKI